MIILVSLPLYLLLLLYPLSCSSLRGKRSQNRCAHWIAYFLISVLLFIFSTVGFWAFMSEDRSQPFLAGLSHVSFPCAFLFQLVESLFYYILLRL